MLTTPNPSHPDANANAQPHSHSHSHAHSHLGDIAHQTTRRLALSLGLTLAFVFIEAAAGLFGNSLALLTDAGHNLTDVIALALTWQALRMAERPAHAGKTFGYYRVGILTALVNSTTLVLIALGAFYEAYRRFVTPSEVQAGVLIGVGALALVVNLGTALLVKKGSESDLNMRSAFVHLMGDVASTAGAVVAGIVIAITGWNWLDPLVSILIGVLILWNAWGILRESVEILLEGTPRDIDMDAIVHDLLAVPSVRGVHDLHVWSLTLSMRALSAHIVTDDISTSESAIIQRDINEVLSHRYHITHATLQMECVGCMPEDMLYCDMTTEVHSHP
jgi:cobalt-zinc-cadmium efflux system protein